MEMTMLTLSLIAGSATLVGGVALVRYVAILWAQLPACNDDFIVEMKEEAPHLPRPAGAADAACASPRATERVQAVGP